ncbi:hypothetical protein JAAARDRAFT_634573 [Jaapia argillacea MUCL 33604]|uniref:Uncharacterized protein n=1 Tax=Jaapia argillacea MUCL 33604 TaxID=933084 RepID=A0A067QBB2_9AGAM|nr:hypothetical protein JAAARDRAFT_634573 [Jaapia argillacea MUCL 33604]
MTASHLQSDSSIHCNRAASEPASGGYPTNRDLTSPVNRKSQAQVRNEIELRVRVGRVDNGRVLNFRRVGIGESLSETEEGKNVPFPEHTSDDKESFVEVIDQSAFLRRRKRIAYMMVCTHSRQFRRKYFSAGCPRWCGSQVCNFIDKSTWHFVVVWSLCH